MAKTFIVRFSSNFEERLERLAEETKKPVSFHIENMLGLYLDEYEEACLALDRSSGKNATHYTSRDVRKLLEL